MCSDDVTCACKTDVASKQRRALQILGMLSTASSSMEAFAVVNSQRVEKEEMAWTAQHGHSSKVAHQLFEAGDGVWAGWQPRLCRLQAAIRCAAIRRPTYAGKTSKLSTLVANLLLHACPCQHHPQQAMTSPVLCTSQSAHAQV